MGPETCYRLNGPAEGRHRVVRIVSLPHQLKQAVALTRGSAAPIADHGAGLRRHRVARQDTDGYLRALAAREIAGGMKRYPWPRLASGGPFRTTPRPSAPLWARRRRARFADIMCRALAPDGYRQFRVCGTRGTGHGGEADQLAWPDLQPGWPGSTNGMRGRAANRLIGPSSRPRPRWSGVGATRTDSPKARAGPSRRHSTGASTVSSSIPTTVNTLRSAWDEALAKGGASLLEYRARTDQEHLCTSVSRGPCRVGRPAGQMREWVGSLADIHEERLARDALVAATGSNPVGRPRPLR